MARRQRTWTEETALIAECRARPYCPRAVAKYAAWLRKQRRRKDAAKVRQFESFLIRRRNRIVETNLGLIATASEKAAYIIHKNKGCGLLTGSDRLSPQDAWSAGALALLRAAECWNPCHGWRFSTSHSVLSKALLYSHCGGCGLLAIGVSL